MMHSRKMTGILAALFCLTALAAVAGDGAPSTAVQQSKCCFENPRYSGTCEATPGPEESCGSILGYLNNPNSVGKDYCGNTTIRGGWSQVECEGSASMTDQCTVDRAALSE
jgi:hypothetical protein